jgi:hypothetical protein
MSDEAALVPAQSGEVAAPAPKKVKKIIRKKRPARPQVDSDFIKSEPPPQTGTIFNIWYNSMHPVVLHFLFGTFRTRCFLILSEARNNSTFYGNY